MRIQRCRVCGSQSNNLHHPSCPIGKSEEMDFNMEQPEEMFVVNEEMLQWISHAIAIAGAQYTEYMSDKNEEKMLTERVAQFQKDYIELADFADEERIVISRLAKLEHLQETAELLDLKDITTEPKYRLERVKCSTCGKEVSKEALSRHNRLKHTT